MRAVSRQLERKSAFFVAGADLKHDFFGAHWHLKNHIDIFAAVGGNDFVERIGRSTWKVIHDQPVGTAPEI